MGTSEEEDDMHDTDGSDDASPSGGQVTPRQLRVLRLVARGLSLEDIASSLDLELVTAQQEARQAITRLGLHTQQDIVSWHRALTAGSDD